MTPPTPLSPADLAVKIARLVEERGWNQEDFARIANLNRNTVHTILQRQNRRLRNATVQACAKALGLTVSELRSMPLDRLLPRMHGQAPPDGDETLRRLFEKAVQPDLIAWLERNPERARKLTAPEVEDLLGVQGADGPLTHVGVERYVEMLERKRELHHRVGAIAGTEYLSLLEQVVGLLYEKVQ